MTTEWLKGDVDVDDAAEEARALLTDPRDFITSVVLWSTREGQCVAHWNRRTFASEDSPHDQSAEAMAAAAD